MCAVPSLVTNRRLAAVRIYLNSCVWNRDLRFSVCAEKLRQLAERVTTCPGKRFLIDDQNLCSRSKGSPNNTEPTEIRVSASLPRCSSLPSPVSSFSPLLRRRRFSLTHNFPALDLPICGEAFGGRRHTSKPAYASTPVYGSLSLTCLKSMYLHGFKGYKQSCGGSQHFV